MDKSEKEELFGDMVLGALLDGELQEEDKARLRTFGAALGLSPADCRAILVRVKEGSKQQLSKPECTGMRRRMFVQFVGFALADGYVDAKERKFLVRLAEHYGISKEELVELIEEAHASGDPAS